MRESESGPSLPKGHATKCPQLGKPDLARERVTSAVRRRGSAPTGFTVPRAEPSLPSGPQMKLRRRDRAAMLRVQVIEIAAVVFAASPSATTAAVARFPSCLGRDRLTRAMARLAGKWRLGLGVRVVRQRN